MLYRFRCGSLYCFDCLCIEMLLLSVCGAVNAFYGVVALILILEVNFFYSRVGVRKFGFGYGSGGRYGTH